LYRHNKEVSKDEQSDDFAMFFDTKLKNCTWIPLTIMNIMKKLPYRINKMFLDGNY
jgi:hypothetical protein